MTSETSGILRWTSSIKDSMINDPGRQFFEDQVQSQGFLFLEEYLDNIWAATKPDSFVDLVKTPGKRRVSPQKARPAVITHTTSLALSDEKDVFQSNPLKLSPSPITSIVESTDHAVDSSPQIPRTRSAIVDKTEVATQPLPSAPPAPSTFVDMSVPLKEEDASANGISRNPSLPQFPSLAAPSPLRKSTRNHRESSLEPNLTTTPGTGLTANHSSWLAKVREAKAIEVTNKRASVALIGLPAPSGGVKRRSGELPDSLSYNGDDNEERKAKIPKTSAGSAGTLHLDPRPSVAPALHISPPDVRAAKPADEAGSDADMIAPLKKAIEVLRARTGKSLAGTLVEASAQEPTPVVRETNVSDVSTGALSQPNALRPSLSAPVPIREAVATSAIVRTTPPKSTQLITQPTLASPPHEGGRRLSISDLVPKHDKRNATQSTSTSETSISTTPPDSPPAAKKTAFFVPGVFVPPPARKPEPLSADSNTVVIKGLVSEPTSYSFAAPFGPSTQSSSFSDNVFESQNDVPSWVPRSQETEITSQEQESRAVLEKEHATDLDDDDSWRIDDKFAATNQMWTPFAGITTVEDSMTWSTVPSQSQIGGRSPQQDPTEDSAGAAVRSQRSHDVIDELDEHMVVDVDEDVKRDMLNETKPMVAVNYDATKSQLSVASSSGESSHPVGFFGHATKLVSSMLGVSKKNKTEPPKSIQLAATAAKKEEQDRRAVRLKEMEARRQAVLQKKAEEEKVKADEEEKKAKEDSERRKREREENTGKRPLVKADSKVGPNRPHRRY
ncbi:hypothetical protein B0F90DRAFT_1681079 [Multifurca ochricompacta]|uniref:Inner centromere protein ARK-binding domain-containing protein n=1 Tax=Multifurca ochricompacta TaxID=376703 RepID=A0AAD4QS80_9AGAM|nr:hypothetical protein B0F90DRAFT_1681079 [Multifurca ochricompacta]